MRKMKSQKKPWIARPGMIKTGKAIMKAFVGLSGGVDSAVSAALLQKDGYDVTGVFIRVWQPDWIECNWKEERLEAMRAAAHLGIPFITLDLSHEYKQGVIDYMIAEYTAGRTPNPDVMCNREVKFGAFWRWAKEQGADLIATGHYARIDKPGNLEQDPRRHAFQPAGRPLCSRRRAAQCLLESVRDSRVLSLLAGIDTNKDQSYFLWTLTQDDLSHALFPIGGMTKPEVRKLAKRFKLPNADKKDSQGLCFLGKVDVKEFLKHYVDAKPGKVLNGSGKTIGTHPGALLFTIGERHGFMVTDKTSNDQPCYIVGKDIKNNTITVTNKDDQNEGKAFRASSAVHISRANWISRIPAVGERLQARCRYRAPLGYIHIAGVRCDGFSVTFEKPPEALTPGQSLVVYDGDICLGGGIIEA